MVLPLVALLLQTPPAPAVSRGDGKPVRVWLASGTTLVRGDAVRVYVQAATDGSLVVLHRRTDGRIDVLFPGHPTDDPSIIAGTYEIRGPGDRESFVVAEPDGTGLILAALSTGSYRFNEFVREASWDPDALVPSWSGADGEGALADVVQRMLGDGYFNYDLVTYTVAPRAYAMQDTTAPYPTYPPCINCSFVGLQLILEEPFFLGAPRFRQPAPFTESGAPPGADPHMRVLALAVGRPQLGSTPARVALRPRYVSKPLAASPTVPPRTRIPVTGGVRAIPLVPGHHVVGRRLANPGLAARSRTTGVAPFHEVHLTLSPTAPAAAPEPAHDSRRGGLVAAPPVPPPARGEHAEWVAAARSRVPAAVAAPSGAPPRGAVMGARTASQARTVARRAAAWHAMAARGAVAAAGRRR